MRLVFEKLEPDLPSLVANLITANNVIPITGGWQPLPSLKSKGETALTAACLGAAPGISQGGASFNFAGDATKLYVLDSGGQRDVSKAGGYDCKERWKFAFFNDECYATSFGDNLQTRSLSAAPNDKFADVSVDAPRFRYMGIIGRHLMGGNLYDARYGNGTVPNGVWWPAQDNPKSWPEPGTSAAQAVQSDFQPLRGEGGDVVAIVSGIEVGAIFQERYIWRADFVGGDVQYEIDRVEPNRGLLVPDLAVPIGRQVFYCAEDGFYIFDYTQSIPIGKDRMNRTFLADWDSAYPHKTTWLIHPERTLIIVGYPGAGNTAGTPNKLLLYDYKLNRFATGDQAHQVLARVLPKHLHLDNLAATDLDAMTGPFATSLDTRPTARGALQIGGYMAGNLLADFSGADLEATFESGDVELEPGYRSQVEHVRPLIRGDGDLTTVEIAARTRLKDTVSYRMPAKVGRSGRASVRGNGRYHRFRTKVPGGFTDAIGLDVTSHRSGVR